MRTKMNFVFHMPEKKIIFHGIIRTIALTFGHLRGKKHDINMPFFSSTEEQTRPFSDLLSLLSSG
jgi:hypothetical protein